MKKFVCIVFSLGCVCHQAFAINTNSEDKKKDSTLTAAFVQKQVSQSMSLGRAIKSIISHYPRDAMTVVDTSLDLYPQRYKEIIHAAISADPTLTGEVVTLALEKGISSCASIVETAINAEPSYVDFVVKAAAYSTPEELDDIVRIAVETEPDSADNIVRTLSRSHPNEMVDIVKTAISAVPFVGEYIVDALLAAFPDEAEQVVTTALRESNEQETSIRRILDTALNAGVSPEDLARYAENAGTDEKQFAFLLED